MGSKHSCQYGAAVCYQSDALGMRRGIVESFKALDNKIWGEHWSECFLSV